MDEQEFENLSPEEQERIKQEKAIKSRNRIFGLLIGICVILLGILVYEMITFGLSH